MTKISKLLLLFIMISTASVYGKDNLEEIKYNSNSINTGLIENNITQEHSTSGKVNLKKINTEVIKVINEKKLHENEIIELKFEKPTDVVKHDGSIQLKLKKELDNNTNSFNITDSNLLIKGKVTNYVGYHSNLNLNKIVNDKPTSKEMLENTYISSKILPRHTIFVGSKLQNVDSSYPFDEIKDSIGSTSEYSNYIDNIDVKIGGNWNFLDYSVAAYDISDELKNNASINELKSSGWAVLKPFYKKPKLGNLEVGSGYYSDANEEVSQKTLSFYSRYKLSIFTIQGKFYRNNYETMERTTSANWSVSNSIALTNNLNIKTTHNRKNSNLPNQQIINNLGLEYSLEESKLLKINNMKLELDASFVQNMNTENSQRFKIQTKYFF